MLYNKKAKKIIFTVNLLKSRGLYEVNFPKAAIPGQGLKSLYFSFHSISTWRDGWGDAEAMKCMRRWWEDGELQQKRRQETLKTGDQTTAGSKNWEARNTRQNRHATKATQVHLNHWWRSFSLLHKWRGRRWLADGQMVTAEAWRWWRLR